MDVHGSLQSRIATSLKDDQLGVRSREAANVVKQHGLFSGQQPETSGQAAILDEIASSLQSDQVLSFHFHLKNASLLLCIPGVWL